jgi:hypothetical protein
LNDNNFAGGNIECLDLDEDFTAKILLREYDVCSRSKRKEKNIVEGKRAKSIERRESEGTCVSSFSSKKKGTHVSFSSKKKGNFEGEGAIVDTDEDEDGDEGLTIGGLGQKFIPKRMSQVDPYLIKRARGDLSKIKVENLANREFVSFRPLPMNDNFKSL